MLNLTYFPTPYEDELLYSVIARYHYYLGNKDLKDTLKEIFGSSSKLPSFDFPSSLEYLSRQLPIMSYYTSDSLIDNHTLFPLYEPFLPKKRATSLRDKMKNGNGGSIYEQIGAKAGSICVKNALCFCPNCVEEDLEKLKESYFRRAHNVQGVSVCYKHGIPLVEYPVSFHDQSRIAFIRLDHKKLNNINQISYDPKLLPLMKQLAKSVYSLLNSKTHAHQQAVYKRYNNLLCSKGLLTSGGNVKQRELYEHFISYYVKPFLSFLESDIVFDSEYNWLKVLTRKPRRVTHPIRHILLIHFLSSSLDNFFSNTEQYTYFDHGPWYCLNPTADHYHQRVVLECKVTADYKTRQPVGTFSCYCGFIYSRKGPDMGLEDEKKIGRIKQFGTIWEKELKELLIRGNLSLRATARVLGCDPKTVVKYAQKLGLSDLLSTNIGVALEKSNKTAVHKKHFLDYHSIYSCDIINYLEKHPDSSRKQLREALKKQYIWFYRHNREWLKRHLPPCTPRNRRNNNTQKRVNWLQRDAEIIEKVKNTYLEILKYPKPIRITQSLIGEKLGIKPLLEQHLDLLPRTKEYLKEITETIEQFQLRRVEWIYTHNQNFRDLKKWELVRLAGLKPNYSKAVETKINQLVGI